MKAILQTKYGPPRDALRYQEIAKPTPAGDQVLIKVRACSVNAPDWRLLSGTPAAVRLVTGLRRPKTTQCGFDVAGQVESIGGNVTQFKAGDEVFGSCRGAFAEYACAPESAFVTKPANLTFEQAACVPVAGFTALQGLRDKGRMQAGHTILVNGASGGIGTFAVQIAKALGGQVTGVCSTRNVEMVRSIGADRVIDYTQEDFTKDAQRYDVIFDGVGNRPLSACRRILKANGILVMAGAPKTLPRILGRALKAVVSSWFGKQKFVTFIARRRRDDLTILRDLLETGKIAPVIDRQYCLSEVPEAIRYVEEGHARGKVVIGVSS